MLLTLPLVPVFMWLIGRYTEERTRERWQALRLLSSHFLDVVRGLPTLQAFNRAGRRRRASRAVGEQYRARTMGTLRVGLPLGLGAGARRHTRRRAGGGDGRACGSPTAGSACRPG